MSNANQPVLASGTFTFGNYTVHRLGYGAMQITGKGIWGPPRDHDESIRVLKRCIELGVDLIDTANSYGPYISEELIAEALHPYPRGLVIATKAGLTRTGPDQWHPVGRPEYLRQECEMSLRRLKLDRIDLYQLHRIDPKVPADEQFGLFRDLQKEGKIGAVGLSEVNVDEIKAARKIVPIATVQNKYNLIDRDSEKVLDFCEKEKIGFIPWFPIASGKLAAPGGPVDQIVHATGATPAEVSLAWLLHRSPVMLPIPGTSTVAHLEQNCRAAILKLTNDQFSSLNAQ
ncbi:MAG: aldo/keto reductase [Phycisphaerae bacterium]|nr:aldo/keto reductase [Phycisphaerae bacterium]